MREMLALQPRFHRREGRRALGFVVIRASGRPTISCCCAPLRGRGSGDRGLVDGTAATPRDEGTTGCHNTGCGARRRAPRRRRPRNRRRRAPRQKPERRDAVAAGVCRVGSNLDDQSAEVRTGSRGSRPARIAPVLRSGLWCSAPLARRTSRFVNAVAGLLTTLNRWRCSANCGRSSGLGGRATGTLGSAPDRSRPLAARRPVLRFRRSALPHRLHQRNSYNPLAEIAPELWCGTAGTYALGRSW